VGLAHQQSQTVLLLFQVLRDKMVQKRQMLRA